MGRGEATRTAIIEAAERLFAEHGLDNVSHRRISAAAGQGNNAAVGYHFGTAADLVAAIVERRSAPVERIRARMLAEVGSSPGIRDWAGCLVRPTAEHLQELGSPTWYARLSAQLATDPRRHALVVEHALRSPALRAVVAGLRSCLPGLPPEVRAERDDMARLLTVHVLAQRERVLAEGGTPARASWAECADGLVDALVGVWTAPVTPAVHAQRA
ncbi:TetR family transcriptional regulator [Kineococcus vitellinus]|uniref:TetR family transcriptional regulator n=1 Tax=Kineococcus vitellinus TaxID=2696565 RepID=UPI00196A5579